MKKSLLLAAGVMLASSGAMAEQATVEPAVYPNYMINTISPNGEWAVSVDPYSQLMTIINIKTGETWEYGDEGGMETYEGGMTNYVSNNGIVASAMNHSQGGYWENGNWNYLPVQETDYSVFPNTISADGGVIAGSVSKSGITLEDTGKVMSVPVVWYRNADGTYSDYVELPYPKTDFTGRVPQYVLIDDISADGKVCAGCVTDYSGRVQEPIVFTQNENGEWSYTLVHPELLNPAGVVFPKYPGESPTAPEAKDFMSDVNADKYQEALDVYANRPMPQIEDFMTAEELAAYQEALNKYYEDPYNNPYPLAFQYISAEGQAAYEKAVDEYYATPKPNPADYMTEAEMNAYNQAVDEYNAKAKQWNADYEAFEEAFMAVLENPDAIMFSMNSAIISPNGKYLGFTAEKYVEDPDSWMGFSTKDSPMIFNLDTNEYYTMDKGAENLVAVQVTDEGWTLAASPSGNYTRKAYVARGTEASFEQLVDLVKEKDTALYEWMKENMTHSIENVEYVYDEETGEVTPVVTVTEDLFEGTTSASKDFNTFAGWAMNSWDYMDENYVYSYIYGVNGTFDGVSTVLARPADFSIKAQRGGVIDINGAVANVTVYDINGRKVFSADAPASQVATGLSNGTYLVTAKAANGRMITKKVAF